MSSDDEDNDVVDAESVEIEVVSARDETTETRSMDARRKLRDAMQADIERFLQSGGRIEQVAPNATSAALNPVVASDSM